MESWPAYLWYELSYAVSMTFFTLANSLRTEGRGNIPRTGPALVIANHQSFFDPVLVGLAARRHLNYLARKTLFRHRPFRWLIESLGAVPIDQDGLGLEGIRIVLALLKQGRAVLVFPEGERTLDGIMHALKPGIHLLLRHSGAPIIPVGIAGAYQALPRSRSYPTFSPLFLPATSSAIAVSVGKPLDGNQFGRLPRDQALADLFGELQQRADRAERLRRKG